MFKNDAAHDAPYGLVLSGGQSTRMGRDKAALPYRDEPQLQRAVQLLSEVCARCFISARADQQDALRQQWPIIFDAHRDIGPLAGIAAAQAAHPDATWLVIACDLPLLDVHTLLQLLAPRRTPCQAVAFEIEAALPEPLCALWLPDSAAAVRDAIEQQQYSPRRLLQQMQVLLLKPDNPAALRNVNSFDEYRTVIAS